MQRAFRQTPTLRAHYVAALPQTYGAALRRFFAHPSPRLLLVWSLGAVLARAVAGPLSWADALVVLAVIAAWPFLEWLIHVLLLHWVPRSFGVLKIDPPVARAHRLHHHKPWILEHVFIPYASLVAALLVLLSVFWALRPGPVVTTGFVVAALMSLRYEWTHYLAHLPVRAKTRFGRALQKNHRRHHFKDPQGAFIVSVWPPV